MIEQIAGTELWSTVVYFLKMAHNFDSARDGETPSSLLYKISVLDPQIFTVSFVCNFSTFVFPFLCALTFLLDLDFILKAMQTASI